MHIDLLSYNLAKLAAKDEEIKSSVDNFFNEISVNIFNKRCTRPPHLKLQTTGDGN